MNHIFKTIGFAVAFVGAVNCANAEGLFQSEQTPSSNEVYEDTNADSGLEATETANVLLQIPMVVSQLKMEKMRVESVTMVPYDATRLKWKYDFMLVEDCARCRPRKGHLMVFKEVRPGDQKTPGVELYSHILRIDPRN
jgi:hypothetical protein